MNRIAKQVDAIREDRRADYLFNTQIASDAVGLSNPKKFGQEWYRRRDWLLSLAAAQPGELAAEFAAIIALGLERRERAQASRPLQVVNHGHRR